MCRDHAGVVNLEKSRGFVSLPIDIFHRILSCYCECDELGSFWLAVSADKMHAFLFWQLFCRVLKERLIKASRHTVVGHTVDTLETSLSNREFTADIALRHQIITRSLRMLEYRERLDGVIWCGYMEFNDPLLPDWSAETVKVVVRSEANTQSWQDMFSWNACFSHTIKLCSQLYNFVPVRPRGQVFAVNEADKQTLRDISNRLEGRDQVMTLRFPNKQGFILRLVSPQQARQRLSRFQGSPLADFNISPDALVCSWESELEHPVTAEHQLESISQIVANHRQELQSLPAEGNTWRQQQVI